MRDDLRVIPNDTHTQRINHKEALWGFRSANFSAGLSWMCRRDVLVIQLAGLYSEEISISDIGMREDRLKIFPYMFLSSNISWCHDR